MMKTKDIESAVKEAKRFIKYAELCINKRNKNYYEGGPASINIAVEDSAICRYASRDLTRILAKMRIKQ